MFEEWRCGGEDVGGMAVCGCAMVWRRGGGVEWCDMLEE